jgi:NAD+ kinase
MQDLVRRRLGLVVHPSRDLDWVLGLLSGWAEREGFGVGQVIVADQPRRVAEQVEAGDCDVLIALGGDGTTLAALHQGAAASRPVMGVACGSVGVLTSVEAGGIGPALDALAAGRWTATTVPALEIRWAEGPAKAAINDLVIVRDGPGQVLVSITVDDVLYARVAGDGVVVSTPLGSSAYTLAAGGPLLAPGAEGLAVTPLAVHGGASAPLVLGGNSRLDLVVDPGYGGMRCEIDGRPSGEQGDRLTVRRREGYAALVTLPETESRLTGLRRRGLVADSPRVLVRDSRLPTDEAQTGRLSSERQR